MNKVRRSKLQAIMETLTTISEELSELASDEADTADALPECFEERKMAMEENADYIHDAVAEVDNAIGSIEMIEGVT